MGNVRFNHIRILIGLTKLDVFKIYYIFPNFSIGNIMFYTKLLWKYNLCKVRLINYCLLMATAANGCEQGVNYCKWEMHTN